MNTINRNLLSTTIVLLFGFGLFFSGTDGFKAFTAEEARLLKLQEEKPEVPDLVLEDSKGSSYTWDEFRGKYVFITFFYTACTTVCPQLETNMAKVYEHVPRESLGEDIVFLSISFAPDQDTPAALTKYKAYFGSDGEKWRMARITEEGELNALLEAFGVIVIPDNNGNFTHNSAFYLVNREGRLQEVLDYRDIDGAAAVVDSYLKMEAN
ncbi:SCO family protein [Bacillus sp. Marseille-Q1617]|uniref:SCO family protein n=1 Tax=Bacillus sp. Marseille-Q1617 TaxID=2736887 RepID=UPI00158C7297|nr:SCO family protein [Bacillus sp. Marseille-Q1617]